MKNLINNVSLRNFLFLPLFILIAFSSCQNEVVEQTGPNEAQTLIANSPLANLISNTTTLDGSFDNIIDFANCIVINLPVTVIVNGIEITIDSVEDLEIIEALFDEFEDDEDSIEIVFPIIIILNDYTEVVINNYEELEDFIDECSGENEHDDDIECIDFQYPITISIFNSDFDIIDTVTIYSDEELHDFIEDLEGGTLASINFPVTMILADGSTLVVNNNEELHAAIEAADDTCDEDDDNDHDDDDNNDIPIDDLQGLMIACTWTVDKLEIGDQDLEDQYEGYVFAFNANGIVTATDPNNGIHEGTWELIQTNTSIKLNLQMNDLPDFNNQMWSLHEIENEEGEFEIDFRQGINRLKFEKLACDENDHCTETQVDAYLAECYWRTGFNGNNTFEDYQFFFNPNQELIVHNDVTDDEIVGVWVTSQDTNGVVIDISLGAPLGDFNGAWTVIECDEHRIKVVSAGSDQPYIVFERDCDNPFECFESFDAELAECDGDVVDGIAEFNLDNVYANCVNPAIYNVTYHESLEDADNNTNAIANPGSYQNTSNPQTVYARVEVMDGSNAYAVFDIALVVENCSTNCTEAQVDLFLMECEWFAVNYNGSNDLIIYELDFNNQQELTITNTTNNDIINAMWTTSQGTNGVILELSNVAGPNIQAINGTWNVVECNEMRLELHNNTNDILVIERECN